VSEKQKVGKGLQSCTSQISALEAMIGGKRVVIIDTPGIDDTRPGMSETDILIGIARRLEVMCVPTHVAFWGRVELTDRRAFCLQGTEQNLGDRRAVPAPHHR